MDNYKKLENKGNSSLLSSLVPCLHSQSQQQVLQQDNQPMYYQQPPSANLLSNYNNNDKLDNHLLHNKTAAVIRYVSSSESDLSSIPR